MTRWGQWTVPVVLALVAAVSGCRRHYDPVSNPRRLSRYEDNLVRLAARDSGCPPVQVEAVRMGETVWGVNTCTGPREYFLHCQSRRRRWGRCRWRRVPTAPESAANVLGCPPQGITQQAAGAPTSRFLSGCGRRVAMGLQCNRLGCGWVPTGPVQSAGGAQPPPGYGAGGTVVIVPAD